MSNQNFPLNPKIILKTPYDEAKDTKNTKVPFFVLKFRNPERVLWMHS